MNSVQRDQRQCPDIQRGKWQSGHPRDNAVNDGHRLHELTGQLVALEGKVDLLHASGLKVHFQAARGGGTTLDFLVNREIYKHLERVADAFEDVANEIDSLVIDHA